MSDLIRGVCAPGVNEEKVLPKRNRVEGTDDEAWHKRVSDVMMGNDLNIAAMYQQHCVYEL